MNRDEPLNNEPVIPSKKDNDTEDMTRRPHSPPPHMPTITTDTAASTSAGTIAPAKVRVLAIATIVVLAVAGGFAGGYMGSQRNGTAPSPIEKQQVVMKTQGELISSIAKTVGPSVVSVQVKSTTTQQDSFFGNSRQAEQESAGTGIIINDAGLIMTNRHVVPEGTTSVSVTLSDGTKFDGVSVVGRTNTSDVLDVAFLKIGDLKGKKLTPAKIGDSSTIEVGAPVVAIGNALGQFENTVTSGIISGHGRSIQASSDDGAEVENLEDLFQTDAAINQGNSGGPLVNLNGEVIGMNTAVASGSAQSIGFAIPIADLKGLIDNVIAKGKLERPYLGVMYLSLTDDVATHYGLDVKRGAYKAPEAIVGSNPIIKDGPADKAGVKPGDVITQVDGQNVDENHSLTSLLGKKSVGDTVKLSLLRSGKQLAVTVTLAAAPAH